MRPWMSAPIERRDPRLVQARDGLVGDLVARVLDVADLLGEIARHFDFLEDLRQKSGGFHEPRGVILKGPVKKAIALTGPEHA